jgi:choline dehydrogenase-like flavoprotein
MSNTAFNYVVVGAGSAGCALAARLSEHPQVSVALIEAGGSDASGWVSIPAGLIGTVPTKRMNWAYETVAQAGLHGRRGYQPRGKRAWVTFISSKKMASDVTQRVPT